MPRFLTVYSKGIDVNVFGKKEKGVQLSSSHV